MVISKTPYRISFCGGGTDLESYYKKNIGCVISTTINKYIYISIKDNFYSDENYLRYSENEIVKDNNLINHKIFNKVLISNNMMGKEICSIADIPSGTGMGSSSVFTVGLLNAVNAYIGNVVSKEWLAKEACKYEIDILKSPIGKQDQYAASYGGLNMYKFNKDGTVVVTPLNVDESMRRKLEEKLVLVYTGKRRRANNILISQNQKTEHGIIEKFLDRVKELTYEMKEALENADSKLFCEVLNESWEQKVNFSEGIMCNELKCIYDTAIRNGAKAGKLLGAGGGGFFMFFCDDKKKFMDRIGHLCMEFKFDKIGSDIVYKD